MTLLRALERLCYLFACVSVLVLFTSSAANAQDGETYILKVRGKKVMIAKGDQAMRKGQIFIAFDENEKRRGAIRITKVGRTKALGRLVKGRVSSGWYLEPHKKRRKRRRSEDLRPSSRREEREEHEADFERTRRSDRDDDPGAIRNPFRAGALLGYAMNSMTVNIPANSTTVTSEMSGNSLEFHAAGTYRIAPQGLIMGTLGLQNFETTGTTTEEACTNSNECTTKITYLMATGNYKFELSQGQFTPWVAGGLGFLLPLSSESNAVDPSSIGLTSVALATAGFDYQMDRDYSLQAMVRYAFFFNNNDSVTSNLLAILAGVEFKL